MRRYRYRRYRRRSTNVIKMKFQSFMDISTDDTSMQIITISAGGREILQRLSPQFTAYKYYKIGNIAVKLVPASTLPVDPTGLSYGVDEGSTITVDPRDQLTPGMMRITNGEDIFENITGLTDDQQHGIYNNMLLDPRWFKWMLQSGVKRHATPRYWQIGQLHQDKWPGAINNIPMLGAAPDYLPSGTAVKQDSVVQASYASSLRYDMNASDPRGFFQTGHRGVLGWLPTDGLAEVARTTTYGGMLERPLMASPPEVEVMKIILPKAYKTKYYYRMFITETVYFRDPIVNFGVIDADGYNYRPLDVFHFPQRPLVHSPDYAENGNIYTSNETGGNYGDR